jgi:hypothetical protein
MGRRLEDVVKYLIGPRAGGTETAQDRQIIVLSLEEFAAGQKQRSLFLGIAILILLIAPVVVLLAAAPKDLQVYALGGGGVLTAGALKYLVDAMTEMSKAHALAVVCQSLDSVDAREVLSVWLKGKKK